MKKFIKISLFITIMFVILCIASKVHAANATATITANKKEVEVGESVTLSVNIRAASWSLTASGNGITTKKYADVTSDGTIGSRTETITLDTSVEGPKTITLTGTVSEPSGEGTEKTSIDTSVTVVVKAKTPNPNPDDGNGGEKDPPTPPVEKATMTKVQVGDKTYTKTGFTVKVANDVTSIKIVPTISNGESYTINGGTSNDVKLEEGTNTVRIKLASGNSYKIYIRREAKEDDTPNIIDEPDEKEEIKAGLKSLLIKGVTEGGEEIELSYAPEFFSEIYEYQMLLDETLANITKLNIEAVGLQNDFTIEIAGNEELKEGENTITITVKSKDGKTTATYTIVVIKEAKVEEVLAPVEVEPEVKKPLWNTTQKILITVFTSIIAIMGIAFAIIEYRYQKTHKKEKEENREEKSEEVTYSGIDFETEQKEKEEAGDVPFATIGFENEADKVDTLKDESETEFQEIEEQTNEVEEELKKQAKSKKGKHF